MVKIFEICSNLGYLKMPKDIMIDIDKVETYPANKVLILCTGTQGEPLAALSRIANGTHKHISLREGDTVVISATPIPGNEKAATKNINQLMKRDANVVFEKGIGIHVSGHGCQEEQKLMINLVKPKYFLPVHGEYAMIKKHKEVDKLEFVGISLNRIFSIKLWNTKEQIIMSEQRIYCMDLVKKEDPEKAVRTPFYQTESTGGSVWVIKPGQTLQKHYHHNSDDIWIVLQGEGIFYPQPNEEVPFKKGHVIVSKKDSCHGAKNTGDEDIIFVSIVAPVPSDYDPINE